MKNPNKKAIKQCKKEIQRLNYAVRGYMRNNNYRKGSYQSLQRTWIWNKAKKKLIEYHQLTHTPLLCSYCKKAVESNPVLHHIKYNFRNLFYIPYIRFFHYNCHQKFHDEIANLKARKWKKTLRKVK